QVLAPGELYAPVLVYLVFGEGGELLLRAERRTVVDRTVQEGVVDSHVERADIYVQAKLLAQELQRRCLKLETVKHVQCAVWRYVECADDIAELIGLTRPRQERIVGVDLIALAYQQAGVPATFAVDAVFESVVYALAVVDEVEAGKAVGRKHVRLVKLEIEAVLVGYQRRVSVVQGGGCGKNRLEHLTYPRAAA